MSSPSVRLILVLSFLAAAAACQSVQLATHDSWTGYVVPVNLYDGRATYHAAELKIVTGPQFPNPLGIPDFRAVLDDPDQYNSPERLNPILTDEQNQPLDLSALSGKLVRVKGWGGRGRIVISIDPKKPLYLAIYEPPPPPRSISGIGLRPSTTIQITRIYDASGRRIKWPQLAQPDITSATPPPKIAWHDPSWLPAHLLGIVVRTGKDSWRVVAGSAEVSATEEKSGEFAVKCIYRPRSTNPIDHDLRAFLTLQRTWDDRSEGLNHPLPPGLSEDQLKQLAPLLEPLDLPVDEASQQKLASRIARLAIEATGKSVSDPDLLADERALVLELIDATRLAVDRQTPAWQQRLAMIKAEVGEPIWASLSPMPRDRTQ